MNPTAGMLQGDSYEIKVSLAPHSKVFITTQSATKIYTMGDSEARVKEVFHVGKYALLEYFPDPYIPFAHSRFNSETEVRLEEGATVFLAEIIFPGRVKKGESFLYDYFIRKTRIFHDNRLIFYDNMVLKPREKKINNICVFDKYSFYGQLICISDKINRDLSDKIHFALQNHKSIKASNSLFAKNGLVVRLLGIDNVVILRAITECFEILRKKTLGSTAIKLRKY
ncbi:MAG: urease accessory protein UreD [Geminocystis sp.]|nr:urease accessory protein UreD [Geminocystis sp.]